MKLPPRHLILTLLATLLACTDSAQPGAAPPHDAGTPDADTPDADPDTTTDLPDPLPQSDHLLLQRVDLFDADGVRRGMDVRIERGWITEVAPHPLPLRGAQPLDAALRALTPSLVDPHVHLNLAGTTVYTGPALDHNLRAHLVYGVTAVMDVGGPEVLLELRDAGLLGPQLRATGPFLTPVGGHPCEDLPDAQACRFITPDTAYAEAQRLLDLGADALKVALADTTSLPWTAPRLDPRAVEAAAQVGLPVIAHIDTNQDLLDALNAGAAILAHPVFLEPLSPEALQAAPRARALHSTLSAFDATGALLERRLPLDPADLFLQPRVRDNWRLLQTNPDLFIPGWITENQRWADHAARNLALLEAADPKPLILPASDAGYLFIPHGYGLHLELRALERLGIPPLELLRRATLESRRLLALPGGRIAPGQPADLLLLQPGADPARSTHDLALIDLLLLDGRPWRPAELRTVDLLTTRQGPTGPCLEDDDCDAGLRCDGLEHRCALACDPPWAVVNPCGPGAYCLPTTGLPEGLRGVCHPDPSCALYAPSCGDPAYDLTCLPVDLDTQTCWPAGPQRQGDRCDPYRPELRCDANLYCSPIDRTCYTLCDPQSPTCTPPATCQLQLDSFGLCLPPP